jgi:hypothetical protein
MVEAAEFHDFFSMKTVIASAAGARQSRKLAHAKTRRRMEDAKSGARPSRLNFFLRVFA